MTASAMQVAKPIIPNYEIGDLLGDGGSSFVFKAKRNGEVKEVALKILRHPRRGEGMPFNEKDILEKIGPNWEEHNIIPLLGSFETMPRGLVLVFPVATSDLSVSIGCSIEGIANIARQVLNGLKHLHDHNIIYGDMKLENVLLVGDKFLLTDFGTSLDFDAEDGGIIGGTLAHMSQELLVDWIEKWGFGSAKDYSYSEASDIWAAGSMILKLLQGNEPDSEAIRENNFAKRLEELRKFYQENPDSLQQLLQKCLTNRKSYDQESWKVVSTLIKGFLKFDPKDRMSAEAGSQVCNRIKRSSSIEELIALSSSNPHLEEDEQIPTQILDRSSDDETPVISQMVSIKSSQSPGPVGRKGIKRNLSDDLLSPIAKRLRRVDT